MRKMFFILFLIGFTTIDAQGVKGHVIDEEFNFLNNVNLTLQGDIITKTDFNRLCKFNYASKNDSITFSKEGYETKKKSLSNLINQKKTTVALDSIIELAPVIVNAKDYKKEEFFLGLKQKTNSRLIVKPKFEIAAKVENPTNRKGKISNVILYLHKTKKGIHITDLEINFYLIDTLSGLPSKKLLTKPLIYRPNRKNRGKRKVDVEKFNIPFPKEGIFVAIKWLETEENKNKSVGPSIRLTTYTSKRLTFNRYDNRKWVPHGQRSSRTGKVANAMIGLDVWVRKMK